MAAITATPEKLDVGRVFQGAFGVISRNFTTFLALSVIFGALPAVLTTVSSSALTDPTNFSLARWSQLGVGSIVAIVANSVLQGALVYATVSDLNGRRASFAECLSTGLAHFLPLIGVAILFALAVFAGMMLFIVPGIMLGLAFCLVSPVVVMERSGVFGAFSRSRTLTRGNRWRIFGLVIIYVILSSIVQGVLGAAAGGLSLAGGGGVTTSAVLVAAISSLIASMLGSAGISVLYSELRRVREGVGANELAAVFD